MKRYLILAAVAIFMAGFHEWAHPHTAQAVAHCFTAAPEDQFDGTYAQDPIQGGGWLVGVNGQARFYCTVNWRVTFQALYKAPSDTTWSLGVDNALYAPSINTHYDAFADQLFTPGVTPPTFTGYWDSGDGLNAARPVCQWQWRIRERFTNTSTGALDNTLYSPTVNPSC